MTHLQDVQHAGHLSEDERLVAAGLQLPQQDGQLLCKQLTSWLPVYTLSQRLCSPPTLKCQSKYNCSISSLSSARVQMVRLVDENQHYSRS